MSFNSELSGFYKLSPLKRMELIGEKVGLSAEDKEKLGKMASLSLDRADKMSENVVGTFALPFGIATNFRINGADYFVPMVTEEPSVIAAASFGAKLARPSGGFTATGSPALMVAQVQLVGLSDWSRATESILQSKQELLAIANATVPTLQRRGGGAKEIEVRTIQTQRGEMLIVHIIVDVGESMGANSVTKMAEGITPRLESMTSAKARLRILSNLAIYRLFTAEAIWKKEHLEASAKGSLSGEEIVEAFLDAWAFADADPFRAATNNKGIMNGVDAVTIATGNDYRAIESSAHAYACHNKSHYSSLTRYEKTPEGDLKGIIQLPLSLGTVGGAIRSHPLAEVSLKILRISTQQELGCVIAAVGLAQNFAAIRALVTEGIWKGHMKLHARNIAIQGGAQGTLIETIAHLMTIDNNITVAHAKELLTQLCHVM